ncbi:MAG: YitT family protein [Eubacteriales bacterium]|nr:YitT family protein [Eubacteriales bacterium]
MPKQKFIASLPSKADFKRFLKNEPRYLLMDILGSFIYAAGVYGFAFNADFAPGGVTGLAMILNKIFDGILPIGTLIILINIPFVILALHYLGGMFLIRTVQTLLFNALFLDVVLPQFPTYPIDNPVANLLAAIFAGAISGLGLSIIYAAGTSTGGSDLLILSLKKIKPHLSLGEITILIDGSIILIGVFVYRSINALLYGIIFTFCTTVVIDAFSRGKISGKVCLIISDHSKEIWQAISTSIGRGATFLKAEGAYTGVEKKVLMCACSKKEVPNVRRVVNQCDDKALTIIMDYSDARGYGFSPPYED